MTSPLQHLLHVALENPLIFDLQQRIFNNYSAVRKEFSDVLDQQSGMNIIDIGCSTGACARSIVDPSQCHYVGIDIESHYVKIAARRSPGVNFFSMDARQMSFSDEAFDLVMFIGVMHHMDDGLIIDCLKEVKRVLRPNGRVIVAEPVFTPGRRLSNAFLKMDRGRHIRDEPGYAALFGGFGVERQRFFDFSIHRFCSFILSPSCLLKLD